MMLTCGIAGLRFQLIETSQEQLPLLTNSELSKGVIGDHCKDAANDAFIRCKAG